METGVATRSTSVGSKNGGERISHTSHDVTFILNQIWWAVLPGRPQNLEESPSSSIKFPAPVMPPSHTRLFHWATVALHCTCREPCGLPRRHCAATKLVSPNSTAAGLHDVPDVTGLK